MKKTQKTTAINKYLVKKIRKIFLKSKFNHTANQGFKRCNAKKIIASIMVSLIPSLNSIKMFLEPKTISKRWKLELCVTFGFNKASL